MARQNQKNSYLNHLSRNLLTSLILFETIETTLAKAKMLKPIAEKFLSTIALSNLITRRYAKKILFDEKAIKKCFELLSPKIAKSKRLVHIYRLRSRKGDGAQKAIITLSDELKTIKPDEKIKQTKSGEKDN
ncbi:MAG: large subunit ribosomal protein L17 [Candidatus Berkelbacteria bacterium Licking1014_7]|uniref:50S ribosomal protein L17 n=1 Tax=Candidatus Berkelbacteria bacterium Licking1014_7 TaxID=2017147 RepID=A0A554LI48_9BACT|nr:MAG: large subunit ribosomal protein L17 [Candidatus Berkelbacteria bacterium Licking1014_7]